MMMQNQVDRAVQTDGGTTINFGGASDDEDAQEQKKSQPEAATTVIETFD